MSDYSPPIDDMQFLLHDVLGFKNEDLDRETTEAILGEAAKLASEVLAPINRAGDENGAKLNPDDNSVKTAPGWIDAYNAYRDGGWNSVVFDEEYGGQAMPWALAFPIQEMWQGANMSFGLCPLLNQGAIEAILAHGSDEQKAEYLPNMISGEWTGTMNLTEPHAGSDLGLLRTKADKQDDGTYKISGQKIWITYGEHDLADNIIHLVIARTPDAGDDVKGISLFIVPKFLADGTRNDVKCVGLDHKLGIHASPTCVMQFGDDGGATGYLVGKEGEGLKYMFTMMNNARMSVGLQGVAIAERAYQHAAAYAAERVQGKSFATGERVTIDQHKDVQRMLMTMKSQIEAGRALAYDAALALDKANAGDVQGQAHVDVMTPIVKAWCTDMAVEVTSIGVQIHGGCGFIEETGAAQYYRDARILPIYEGTNGIQALDLAFRKTLRDGGAAVKAYIASIKTDALAEEFASLEAATDALLAAGSDKNLDLVQAMATPYLKGFGIIAGAAMLEKSAAISSGNDTFDQEKQKTSAFFKGNILPLAQGYLKASMNGSAII
jgi:alkylation response protein AidB-like acyl-CoA dehydrogenase